MKNRIIKLLSPIRSILVRNFKPLSTYWLAKPSIKPLSNKFGYDRGTPIDRFYIEKFISENSRYVKGHVLEIGDDEYTTKYGKSNVTELDILDIDTKNKIANIHGDIRSLDNIRDNTYDCIVLTHVLGMIDDLHIAVSELKRILKPGGVILVTVSCFAPSHPDNLGYWRFTKFGSKYLFSSHFDSNKVVVKTLGNVLSSQCFWVGASQEDLTLNQLEYNDERFPCIVTIVAEK